MRLFPLEFLTPPLAVPGLFQYNKDYNLSDPLDHKLDGVQEDLSEGGHWLERVDLGEPLQQLLLLLHAGSGVGAIGGRRVGCPHDGHALLRVADQVDVKRLQG